MSDCCPLSSQWLLEREEAARVQGQSSGPDYRRGGLTDRGQVAIQPDLPPVQFPAIPLVARGWKLVKEEGPAFELVYGKVPTRVLRMVLVLFQSGLKTRQILWFGITRRRGRRSPWLFLQVFGQERLGNAHSEFASLGGFRASHGFHCPLQGLWIGGYVRFGKAEDFETFRARITDSDIIAQAFSSETELSIFCYSARIAVPPFFTQR